MQTVLGWSVRAPLRCYMIGKIHWPLHVSFAYTNDDDACSVILKVMGRNQYVANKPVLTGFHHLELRLLAAMGYEVLVVSSNHMVLPLRSAADVVANF